MEMCAQNRQQQGRQQNCQQSSGKARNLLPTAAAIGKSLLFGV